MHCEKAPCEPVCPVGATAHSSEGLNDNGLQPVHRHPVTAPTTAPTSPRFNFSTTRSTARPSLQMLSTRLDRALRGRHGEVHYCVQRINAARSTGSARAAAIREGEIVPPASRRRRKRSSSATHDPGSAVKRWKRTRATTSCAELGRSRARPTWRPSATQSRCPAATREAGVTEGVHGQVPRAVRRQRTGDHRARIHLFASVTTRSARCDAGASRSSGWGALIPSYS